MISPSFATSGIFSTSNGLPIGKESVVASVAGKYILNKVDSVSAPVSLSLSVKVKVTPHHGGEGVVIPTDFTGFMAAKQAMETSFGKTPIPVRSGGSIPIVPMFEEVLGLKTILLGFGLDSDVIHSPNEHYGLFNFYKGIETIPLFYQNFATLNKK